MLDLLLFGITVIGAVFFILWANETFKKAQLLQLSIGLLTIGVVGSLVSTTLDLPNYVPAEEIEELKRIMSTN